MAGVNNAIRTVAVIDIGKTNAKVALVDLESLTETDLRKTPNVPVTDGLYPHHDVERLWDFILDGLAALNRGRPVDALSITTHGATAALLDADENLALPVLDYEYEGPDSVRDAYSEICPPFAETGSPRLAGGLNLGAQLFWQARAFPDAFARVASILMYPQYWAFRLTGVQANEITSLGCHTDLWNPVAADFSSLVGRMGWRSLFPALRSASARLGPILPQIATRTGLAPATPVLCGLHDSNASLLPHLLSRRPPFAVVSTGTWVVSMAVADKSGGMAALDPARDTLVNVNARGDPVASARFMGGREYAALTDGLDGRWSDEDVAAVLDEKILLLPSVHPGSGPFPDRRARWIGREPASGKRIAAASFYLALMTATCLDLIGAAGAVVVEGPFAENCLFIRMLAAATGRAVIARTAGATGTSVGAALLAGGQEQSGGDDGETVDDAGWTAYAETWRAAVSA